VLGGLAHIIAPTLSNGPTTRYPRCTIVAAVDGAAPAVRSNYLRLVATQPEAFQLQTATVRLALTTARGTDFTVDLISTVHVASPDYYEEMQAQLEGYDRVLLELLLDDASVTSEVDAAGNTVRRLNTDISAPPALQQLAGQYGLRTQVDALDCRRSNAVIADVSRRQLAVQESRLQLGQARRGSIGILPPVPRGLSALVAPLRSIFLGSRASGLRPLLLLLPAPELLMLLDDWIGSGGAAPAPSLRPLATALGRFDLAAARRLSFAQTLAGGETTQEGTLAGSLVRWRNERAVQEVDAALASGCTQLALVYGALHQRDLRSRLLQRYELVSVSDPTWRPAWTIAVPNDDNSVRSMLTLSALSAGLLALDAADWIDAVEALLSAAAAALAPSLEALALIDPAASSTTAAATAAVSSVSPPGLGVASLAAALYIARHALFYVALRRYAFEWDSRWWAVEADDA